MDKRLRDAFTALREIRDNAAAEITYYTGKDRAGVWLPLRREDIDSFSSTAAELRNKIDAWQALGIDEHTVKPSIPIEYVELLDRAFDAITATEAVLKDLEALHAGLLTFVQLLRERSEMMRPEERIYWNEAEPHDNFQVGKFFQDRPSNYVRSIYAPSFYDQAIAKLEENPETMNSEVWELTDFAQVVSMGVEWNADSLPAGCLAWARNEIAVAEIEPPRLTATLTAKKQKRKVEYIACLRHPDSRIQRAAAELNAKATERTKQRVLIELSKNEWPLPIDDQQADSMIRAMAAYERRNRS